MGIAQEPVSVLLDEATLDPRIVIADITIQWGRDDIYAPGEPATATVTLFDRDGALVAGPARNNADLRIMLGTRTLFRGNVTRPSFKPYRFTGDDGETVDGWLFILKAADPLAAAGRMVPEGGGWAESPAYGEPNYPAKDYYTGAHGVGYFNEPTGTMSSTSRANRFLDLLRAHGALDIVSSVAGASLDFPVAPVDVGASLLEHLNRVYTVPYLHRPTYNPDGHSIARYGPLTVTNGPRLVYASGTIYLLPADNSATNNPQYSVPASMMEMLDDEPEVTMPELTAITQVKVNYAHRGTDYWRSGTLDYSVFSFSDQAVSRDIAGAPAGVSNILEVDWTPYHAIAGTDLSASFISALDTLTGVVESLNGRTPPPALAFDFRYHGTTGHPAVDLALLSARPRTTVLYFPGSIFNRFDAVSPLVHIIGGTLQYGTDGHETITEYDDPDPGIDHTFRPGTFNIRLASAGDTGNRAWSARKAPAASTVIASGVDILTLNEVSYMTDPAASQGVELINEINAQLGEPERWAIVNGTGGSNCIAWDDTIWERVTPATTVPVNVINTVGALRTAVHARFRHRSTGRMLHWIATHWQHDDPDAANGHTRRAEAAQISAQLMRELAADGDTVILAGDFNDAALDDSSPRGVLAYQGFPALQVAAPSLENGRLNSHNNWDATMAGKQAGNWLDGLNTTPDLRIDGGGLYADFAAGNTLPLRTPLPSDHQLVYADCTFRVPRRVTRPRRGWRVEPILSNVAYRVQPITYANWVTNTTATYADFDDAITYGELGAVTEGAS